MATTPTTFACGNAPALETATCHCGQPPIWHPAESSFASGGFTRSLCEHCDAVRCDAYPGDCGR